MKKHKVKVLEEASEVSWSTTHVGVIEVDGTRVEYRYFESNKSSEFYVWNEDEGGWEEFWAEDEDESPEAVAFNLCTMNSPADMGVEGEEYEYEIDESFF
jgi:hypothetical protein